MYIFLSYILKICQYNSILFILYQSSHKLIFDFKCVKYFLVYFQNEIIVYNPESKYDLF